MAEAEFAVFSGKPGEEVFLDSLQGKGFVVARRDQTKIQEGATVDRPPTPEELDAFTRALNEGLNLTPEAALQHYNRNAETERILAHKLGLPLSEKKLGSNINYSMRLSQRVFVDEVHPTIVASQMLETLNMAENIASL